MYCDSREASLFNNYLIVLINIISKTMKNKILILLAALTLFTVSASSQNTGISFGLRGGVNLQTINGKDLSGDKLDMSMVPRFHAGIVVSVPIAPDFYIQPGLLYSTKGAKSSSNFLSLDMAAEYNISYVEMPVSFLYKPALGNGHFFLGFGPYIAYGIGGKAKFTIDNTSTEDNIVFANEYQSLNPYDWKYFKRLDYGGNLFFGYELAGGLSIQLNTQLGLAKINATNTTYPDNKSEFRNTGFGLSLGYNF
jgi:hypothetical protein